MWSPSKFNSMWKSMIILLSFGSIILIPYTLAWRSSGPESDLIDQSVEQSAVKKSIDNESTQIQSQTVRFEPPSALQSSPPESSQVEKERSPIPPSTHMKEQSISNDKSLPRMGGAGKCFTKKCRGVRKSIPPSGLDKYGRPVFKYVWIRWTGRETSLFIEYAGILDSVLKEEDLHDVQFERRLVLGKDATAARDLFLSELDMYLDDEVTVRKPSGEFFRRQKGEASLTPRQRELVSQFAITYYEKLKCAWNKATILSSQTQKAPWDRGVSYEYVDEPIRFMCDVEQRRLFLKYILELIPEKESFLQSVFTQEQWTKRKNYWDSKHILTQLNLFDESH